jgi:hypothetical protein
MELLSQYNHKSTYGEVVNSIQPKVQVPGSNPFGLNVFAEFLDGGREVTGLTDVRGKEVTGLTRGLVGGIKVQIN